MPARIILSLNYIELPSAEAVVQACSYLAVMRDIKRRCSQVEIFELGTYVLSNPVFNTTPKRRADLLARARAINAKVGTSVNNSGRATLWVGAETALFIAGSQAENAYQYRLAR